MKSSRFPILIIGVLLALLGLLAFLQYRWLGQISDGERERMTRTVKADTERFSEDFNREIQNAYFNFQMNADVWRDKNWKEFNERYDFYKGKTAYPELVKDFYFVELGENPTLLKYRKEAGEFSIAEWNDELNNLKPNLADENFNSINEEMPALLMPVHELTETVERVIIRTKDTEDVRGFPRTQPKKFGVLIIELDRKVIENKILPDLAKKYFSENESADYNLSVVNKNNQPVFQKGGVEKQDASAKIFNLVPDKFVFFSNREILPRSSVEQKKSIVLNKIENTTDVKVLPEKDEKKFDIKIVRSEQNASNEKPRVQMLEGQMPDAAGVWTLNVQHSAGSLEEFITNTRYKNLAVSFSILSLLAVSIILIFVSSQRAKLFAQRQVDFVSSVSHEFRTPLAVIYSAGENLSDGVVRDEEKIFNYGNLIKREGKKLSAMVEQILDFAGAKSGNRKYDFQKIEVKKIIEEAIAECQPLIEENNFEIEKEFAGNLPEISGDKQALTQAVQNLIANSIKYSNGEKFIKISAQNGGGKVKISVEDKGLGIEKNEIGKIFEPFYRSKQVVDAQIHGNGLGLSLVKQIVEAHGGRIEVESEIGKGSCFTIVLTT
ncbi:hypothetical protein BH20ACI4_BH20ACI4_34820 [soil metagenome]